MNRVAFQTYGTKKLSLFQSVWKTDQAGAVSTTELAGITATGTLTNWALASVGGSLLNGGYTHTAGSTAVLQFGLVPTAGQSYQMKYTATGTGTFVINFGGISSAALNPGTNVIVTLTPKTAATLSITPSSSFVGTVSLSIKQSSSATNQIQLPISIASGKSIWVDWGDGQYSTMNNSNIVANRIHTYAASDTYTVRVFGDDFTFGFGNGGFNDRLKLRSISSWGKLKIVANSFYGCSYVTMSGITDIPNLTGVTDLSYAFSYCALLTTIGRINEWDTSLVTNMSYVFNGSPLFNDNIGSWNTSAVSNMRSMFEGASSFNQPIGSWNVSNVTNMSYMFDTSSSFNQPIGSWNVSNVTDMSNMFDTATAFNKDISNWNVSNVTTFTSMFSGAAAFNNGSALGVANQLPWNINTTAASVNMFSMFQNATAFNSKLGTGTTPWNVSKVTTFADMFYGASNFRNGDDTAPINNWNIGGSVTLVFMTGMFRNAIAFNRNISSWNVTKVNSMSNMFYGASSFNQPIGSWNVSNVTQMAAMFRNATAFNQPLVSWNVSKVTTFANMFQSASAFNQPIETWAINTTLGANVNMSSMFVTTGAFNQPLNGWNTSEVTNMSSMFGGSVFNNGLLSGVAGTLAWNTGKVTSMSGMFGSNFRFNCNVGGFNVSACTNFSIMFQEATSFNNGGNSSINNWNIGGNVTAVDMSGMFKNAIVFNQDISSWSVSKVTEMDDMFNTATAFNQSLSNWERVGSTLSNVTTMERMFNGATAFNQPIGNWNVSNVVNFINFMNGKTPANFSTANLNAIYNGWGSLPSVKPNTTLPLSTNISFGTAKYTAASSVKRAVLTSAPNNWIIQDGGI